MLKTNKSITLNGRSEFDGSSAMMFGATINPGGSLNVNANIMNQSVYDNHSDEAQKDMEEFNKEAFKLSKEIGSNDNYLNENISKSAVSVKPTIQKDK